MPNSDGDKSRTWFDDPGEFAFLEPRTYWVDSDDDPCTSLRVLFTVPADGWQAWVGAFKEEAQRLRADTWVSASSR
jgi:hypothetical protein